MHNNLLVIIIQENLIRDLMRVDCGEGEQSIVSGSSKDTAVDSTTGHKYSLPIPC